jgi:hypothetical protein
MNRLSKVLILLPILAFMLINANSCNIFNPYTHLERPGAPPPPTGSFIRAEIRLQVFDYDILDILADYEVYQVKLVSAWNQDYVITFNDHLIDGYDLVVILANDHRVLSPSLTGGWIKGELRVELFEPLTNDELDIFIEAFTDWDLKVISHTQRAGYLRVSFNSTKIDQHEFMWKLCLDPRVRRVDFNGPGRLWRSGSISLDLSSNNFNSFIRSYSDVIISSEAFSSLRLLFIDFDYNRFDEFKLLEMFNRDRRVRRAGFDEIERGV